MSKQIVLIIVEGISEKNALEGIFKVILQKENIVELVVYDGDILTSSTPIDKIIRKCLETLTKNGFLANDLKNIIQIADLDGCYIDNTKVIEKPAGNIRYNDTTIECTDIRSVTLRNQNKRNSINELRTTKNITIDGVTVPFKLYYNSCNLEHVLYGARSLSGSQKATQAMTFALRFDTRETEFIPFIKASTLSKEEDELWEFIKTGSNSLSKSSTMYFLFDEE